MLAVLLLAPNTDELAVVWEGWPKIDEGAVLAVVDVGWPNRAVVPVEDWPNTD